MVAFAAPLSWLLNRRAGLDVMTGVEVKAQSQEPDTRVRIHPVAPKLFIAYKALRTIKNQKTSTREETHSLLLMVFV